MVKIRDCNERKIVIIRRAELKDIEYLLDLWEGLMRYHQELDKKAFSMKKNARSIMRSFFIKNIKSKNSIVLLAESSKKSIKKPIAYLMGFIQKQPLIYVDDKYGYISDAFVREEYRSKGMMKEMIGKAEAFFKSKSLKTLSGKVFIENKNGLSAWKEMGFKEGAVDIFREMK